MADTLSQMISAQRNGWAKFDQFLDREELLQFRREINQLLITSSNFSECLCFYTDSSLEVERPVRIECFWENIRSLAIGSIGRKLHTLAGAYLGKRATLFKDKVNVRLIGSSGYSPHQDAAAGWHSYAKKFVTIGLFLSTSNSLRGGFEVAAQHHRLGRIANNNGKIEDQMFCSLERDTPSFKSGDAILLDGEAPHRTLMNCSDDEVIHILFTFNSFDEGNCRSQYYEKKKRDFQQTKNSNRLMFRVFTFSEK